MTRIALLCPTRGRAEKCARMIDSAMATSSTNVQVILGIQEDQLDAYFDLRVPKLIVADQPPSHTWNMLAEQALLIPDIGLFMLAADDMVFATPGWDIALLEHYEALKEKAHVYAFQDSRDRLGTPHPVVSRDYMLALGYFCCPIFLHWYVDTWAVSIAKANGVFTHLKDYLLRHDKPSDTGAGDETHNRIRRAGWRERDAYVAKTCDHMLKGEIVRLGNYLRKKNIDHELAIEHEEAKKWFAAGGRIEFS